jgi:hypothetical protein
LFPKRWVDRDVPIAISASKSRRDGAIHLMKKKHAAGLRAAAACV